MSNNNNNNYQFGNDIISDTSGSYPSPIFSSDSGGTSPTPISISDDDNFTLSESSSVARNIKKGPIIDYKFPFHFAVHRPNQQHRAEWRTRLGDFIESNRVQTFIVILIALDLAIAVTEMFLEESFKKCSEEDEAPHSVETAEEVLRIITFIILGIFEVEILCLIVAFGRDFIFHPLYVLDFVVTTVSIVVDIVFRDNAGALLVVFRLWRVIRVGHGIAMTVEEHDEKKYGILMKKYRELKKKYNKKRQHDMRLPRQIDN